MDSNTHEIVKELTSIFSQIGGVKKVSENLTLTYVVVVADEDSKQNVEKVGSLLSQQAKKYGFELEVVPATEEEIQQAKDKASEYVRNSITFKA